MSTRRSGRFGLHVPNAPFREAVVESGMTISEVCHAIGWWRHFPTRAVGDTARLKRELGIIASGTRNLVNGRSYTYKTYKPGIQVAYARAICEAIGASFDDLLERCPEVLAREWFETPHGSRAANHRLGRLEVAVGELLSLVDPPLLGGRCNVCSEAMVTPTFDRLCGFCREERQSAEPTKAAA